MKNIFRSASKERNLPNSKPADEALATDGMRKFNSLAEFDDFYAKIKEAGDDAGRISMLSNSYLVDPNLIEMPDDPFSPEYRQAVLNIHARICSRTDYEATTMELSPLLNVEETIAHPAAYQNGGEWLGNYLESYGHLIRRMEIKPGMRVIEYGCGDAEISLHLARLGCDVTVVDIEPKYIEIIREKASRLRLPIKIVQGDFSIRDDIGRFDRVFYYQSFHHSLEHQDVIADVRRVLTPDGFVVFGTEPVIEDDGPWRHAVPYAWGPRLDGLSLLAIRNYGWMELGFRSSYFAELLRRNRFAHDKQNSPTNGLVFSIVAKPTTTRE